MLSVAVPRVIVKHKHSFGGDTAFDGFGPERIDPEPVSGKSPGTESHPFPLGMHRP